jgi:hypothetical protein
MFITVVKHIIMQWYNTYLNRMITNLTFSLARYLHVKFLLTFSESSRLSQTITNPQATNFHFIPRHLSVYIFPSKGGGAAFLCRILYCSSITNYSVPFSLFCNCCEYLHGAINFPFHQKTVKRKPK